MPTIQDIITEIIRVEGAPTNDPNDSGGRTQFGISESANPEAWVDGKVTEEEAREIYERKYVRGPGFDKVSDLTLKSQLIDFGVTSGPQLAIMKLQEILHVKVDGVLGPLTLAAINTLHPEAVNGLLVISRVKMICRLVQKVPTNLKYLTGWVTRALEFL
jgi:lysozyme family protein